MQKVPLSERAIELLLNRDNPFYEKNQKELLKWFSNKIVILKDSNGNEYEMKRCNELL